MGNPFTLNKSCMYLWEAKTHNKRIVVISNYIEAEKAPVSQVRLGSWVGGCHGLGARRRSLESLERGHHRAGLITCGDPGVQVQPLHHNVV